MPAYTITPWRTQADLLELRSQLYRLNESLQDERAHAVARVMAWRQRGHLPHAVESTALIVDAFLHHDVKNNSSFSIRAVYSAAFCRFVTGFCDIGRNRERLLEPSSMLTIARQIDMPEGFVALRHEATHEELPGEQRIVAACEDALQWLWRVYWSKLDDKKDTTIEQTAVRTEDCIELAQKLFKEYRSAKKAVLKKPRSGGDLQKVLGSANTLVDRCSGNEVAPQAINDEIVQKDWLIPADRDTGSSMDGAFMLWEDLLLRLCSLQAGFVDRLVHSCLNAVDDLNRSDEQREAYALWLARIAGSSWSIARQTSDDDLLRSIMKHCCLHPNAWTIQLGKSLLASGDETFKEEWSYLLEAMAESDVVPETVADTTMTEAPQQAAWYRSLLSPTAPLGIAV